MKNIEARIYRIQILFRKTVNIKTFCHDLSIRPENTTEISEDKWGLRDYLELWFQEIIDNRIVLHIQKQYYKSDRKYIENLQQFFEAIDSLDYVENIVEIN